MNSSSEVLEDVNNFVSSLTRDDFGEADLYRLFDLSARGILADKMEEALFKFDLSIVDRAILEYVTPYLYNNGNGKWIPKNLLVARRIHELGGKKATIATNLQERKVQQLFQRSQPDQNFQQNIPPDSGSLTSDRPEENIYCNFYDNLYIPEDDRKLLPEEVGAGDRLCCWDIWKRGSMGENLLHVCLLSGTNIAKQLAVRLLKHFPVLVVDIYLSNEYYGQTPLHMALVNEDLPLTKMMLDLKDADGHPLADLSARCNGSFFIPLDQKNSAVFNPKLGEVPITKTETSYSAACYWGEFPLSFAVCLGVEDHFIWLLHRGADPNATDLNGNNILHMLVIHNKLDMFKSVIELLEDEMLASLLGTRNRQRFTPLTLAAFCGRKDIFNLIMSYQSTILWVYGHLHAVKYSLCDVDTVDPDGKINKDSALHIIAMQEGPAHVDMLDGVLKEVIDWKWDLFGRQMLVANFIVYILFLISYLTMLILKTPTGQSEESQSSCYMSEMKTNIDKARSAVEVWTFIQLLIRILVEVRQFRDLGMKLWYEELCMAPTKVLFLTGVFVLIPLSVLSRIICKPVYEDYACCLTALFIAPHTLFYIRNVPMLGPLIIVLYRALSNDLRRFLIMMSILITSYSLSMIVLFKNSEQDSPMSNFFPSLYLTFCMILGEVNPDTYSEFEKTPYKVLAKMLWVAFFVLTHFLLLNILVSMVYETFHMYKQSHHAWYKQRMKVVVLYEYLLPERCRQKVMHQYSHANKPPNSSTRSVIVKHFNMHGVKKCQILPPGVTERRN